MDPATTASYPRDILVTAAAVNGRTGRIGIAVSHRRQTAKRPREGHLVAAYAEAYDGIPVDRAAAFAALRGLEIARDAGAERVKVRIDQPLLRRQLKCDYAAGFTLEDNGLHSRIIELARSAFREVTFSIVAKHKTYGARHHARRARDGGPAAFRFDIDWDVPWHGHRTLWKILVRHAEPSYLHSAPRVDE